jgi:hypothetical protein
MKIIKFVISIIISLQLTGFTLGLFYSSKVCKEGLLSFSDTVNKIESDKVALFSAMIIYPSFYLGAKTIDIFSNCGKVHKGRVH